MYFRLRGPPGPRDRSAHSRARTNGGLIRVLLITADAFAAARVTHALAGHATEEGAAERFLVHRADHLDAGLAALDDETFDAILLDPALPDHEGLRAFAILSARAPDAAILFLAGRDDEILALKALQHGAEDYLLKEQLHDRLVQRSVSHAVQRRSTERELAAEKERLAVTLRSIGEGVVTTDTRGAVILVNRMAETLTGWTQAEAEGRPLAEVFPILEPGSRAPCRDPVRVVLDRSGPLDSADALLAARDGRERIIEYGGAPIRDATAAVSGVALVFRDVTEKRRMHEELIKAEKLESVGLLAGGIAHDFNNLLAVILGNVSLARQQSAATDALDELLAGAETAALRARDLMGQLLTFSRGGEPVKRPVRLGALLEDVARRALDGTDVAASVTVPRDTWVVELDTAQMRQALENLVVNARQAMPEGGTVDLRCENMELAHNRPGARLPLRPGRYVRITVQDHGIGIPADAMPRIFDPYFTTRADASGLGLASAYSIAKHHGGLLTARSTPGEGSTFELYLPAGQRAEPPAPATAGAGRRVLVMDDDDTLRTIIRKMLEQLDYDVTTVGSGEEALDVYRRARDLNRPFAAVILDLTVADGLGGMDTLRALLEIDPDVAAIVSSGYSDDPVMARFRQHGFRAVIPKPYKLEELREILSHVVTDGPP